MTLLLSWVVLPLLLLALALGCGFLLEQLTGVALAGALRLPAGFALVLVVAALTTMSARTAGITVPLLVSLAVAGAALRIVADRQTSEVDRLVPRPRTSFLRRPGTWATAAALAVYAVYAAPVVLSGSATFAGYISLDDTATWLAFADNALVHGRSLAGLSPSTYWQVLHDNLPAGYPIASFLPLGVGHELTGEDAAWLFQPYIAFLAALLSLALFALTGPLVRRAWLRALVAFVGAQPALLVGYAFWSGIKEVTVAYLVALVAALAAADLAGGWRLRGQLLVSVASAALLVSLGVVGAVWLAGLALFVVLYGAARGPGSAVRAFAVACGGALVLAIPALATAWRFLRSVNGSDSGHGALGNLFHPLSGLQLFGIWPTGDFRGRPSQMLVTYLLLGLVATAAAFGIVEAARRRLWALPLYGAAALVGWGLVAGLHLFGHGSPWLDAKALAEAAPSLLVAALAGAAALVESTTRPRRTGAVLGVAALAAIAAGVVWSNALAYGSVWLAPRGQLAELQTIGGRFAGAGPTLMTEYQPYGVRHFLRNLDAEGASERRTRPVSLRAGGLLGKAQYADLDAFALSSVQAYRTLVLRVSPLESRPPSSYVPVWAGHWYEVWQRPLEAATVLAHLPLGTGGDPNGVPACAAMQRLGAIAAASDGYLVASLRPQPRVFDLGRWQLPSGWQAGPGGTVVPTSGGIASETIDLLEGGQVGFWVGGSFRGRLELDVDGTRVGSAQNVLEETAQLTPLGEAELPAGNHEVELRYSGAGWRPGSRGAPFLLGPLVIGEPATAARLVRVAPAQAAALCGRSLDWIEAVAAS